MADKKKDKRSRRAGAGTEGPKRGRGDPAGEKRARIKKSKKRKLKKAEKKAKASLSDTDSEEDEDEDEEDEEAVAMAGAPEAGVGPPGGRGGAGSPAKLGGAGEGKECASTETSQDGDASSSEGELRVMDEDIMVESGEGGHFGPCSENWGLAVLPAFNGAGLWGTEGRWWPFCPMWGGSGLVCSPHFQWS